MNSNYRINSTWATIRKCVITESETVLLIKMRLCDDGKMLGFMYRGRIADANDELPNSVTVSWVRNVKWN
jgi:hypothetical protein